MNIQYKYYNKSPITITVYLSADLLSDEPYLNYFNYLLPLNCPWYVAVLLLIAFDFRYVYYMYLTHKVVLRKDGFFMVD